jgi:hypothetical protein
MFPKQLTGEIYAGFFGKQSVDIFGETSCAIAELLKHYQNYEASSHFRGNVTL